VDAGHHAVAFAGLDDALLGASCSGVLIMGR
jgi:hypothetical protein